MNGYKIATLNGRKSTVDLINLTNTQQILQIVIHLFQVVKSNLDLLPLVINPSEYCLKLDPFL